jgi:hypothetical protein
VDDDGHIFSFTQAEGDDICKTRMAIVTRDGALFGTWFGKQRQLEIRALAYPYVPKISKNGVIVWGFPSSKYDPDSPYSKTMTWYSI